MVAEIRRSIAAKVDVSVELYNYRKDGKGFWNALYLSPVLNDSGDLLYLFSTQLDTTARHEAEAMLARNQHTGTLGSTAASPARELRDLLMTVRSDLEQACAGPSSELRSRLADGAREVRRAERVVQQMLVVTPRWLQGAGVMPSGHAADDSPALGGGARPAGWKPAVVLPFNGNARPTRAAAASGDGGAAVAVQSVRVDTQGEDEEGCFVFGDERLVAVLVRLSDQHGELAGRWCLEHGFGMLDGPDHPCFTNLDARSWVWQRLGRS